MRNAPASWFAVLALIWAHDGAAQERAPSHPEPRVIVTVPRVRGPHERSAVEHAARTAWGGIVRCYKLTKHDGKPRRGTVEALVDIRANGEIIGARRRGGTLKGELARCLVKAMRKVTMPRARSHSTAEVVIKVAPGDA